LLQVIFQELPEVVELAEMLEEVVFKTLLNMLINVFQDLLKNKTTLLHIDGR
jgi:hypothetical protein